MAAVADLIYGEFADKTQQLVRVYIKIPGGGNLPQIGGRSSDDADIYFTTNPVEISTEIGDTFDVILMKSCTVNLYIKQYLGDKLFTSDSRNIILNVWKGDKCLFAGFIEPNIYNQPYNHTYDQLSLNFTDALATFQYFPYKNILTDEQYQNFRQTADKVSLESILSNIFNRLPVLNLVTGRNNSIYYDGSVRPTASSSPTSIFSDVQLYDLLWAGEELDDMMTEEEVLEEVLRYLDLHIIQEGCNFHIFCWQTIKDRRTIDWYPICLNGSFYVAQSRMMMRAGRAREMLVSMDDSAVTIPGNLLATSWEDKIEYRYGDYIQYEVAELPSTSLARTGNWRYADLSDMDFLRPYDTDDYYIFLQEPSGDYNVDEMRSAPQQCYENNTFIYSYFEPSGTEWVATEINEN